MFSGFEALETLGADKAVVLCEGMPRPVLCGKIRYHQDRHFTARLLPRAVVPTLAV